MYYSLANYSSSFSSFNLLIRYEVYYEEENIGFEKKLHTFNPFNVEEGGGVDSTQAEISNVPYFKTKPYPGLKI